MEKTLNKKLFGLISTRKDPRGLKTIQPQKNLSINLAIKVDKQTCGVWKSCFDPRGRKKIKADYLNEGGGETKWVATAAINQTDPQARMTDPPAEECFSKSFSKRLPLWEPPPKHLSKLTLFCWYLSREDAFSVINKLSVFLFRFFSFPSR